MKTTILAVLASVGFTCAATAQPPASNGDPSFAKVLEQQFTAVERDFVSAAAAMPEEKFSFAPSSSNGTFSGVRTFAQEVKHVAVYNFRAYRAILGEAQASDGENGPDSVRTKTEILAFLRDSFAIGHRAIATINAANILGAVKNSPERGYDTPLALAIFSCWHAFDHYGQMVEYLRMNGIVPPASSNASPANPSAAGQPPRGTPR